jgi:DNA primase
MAGRIPRSFIDELVARSDIVELIGSRVQLRKAGREYKACCPFHGEKTPSFYVVPDKQFYHCFGCGVSGTVVSFLMEHDRMTFVEAIEELAARAGLEVPHEQGTAAPAAGEELYETLERVARYWARALPGDARARAYVEKRGLTPQTAQRFMIGYAANSWNDVLRRFGQGEAERRALLATGLIVERDAGAVRDGERHYDRFRDRLMFPIRDARGRVIAFGGRVIDQGEPKYLNSPETALFHKGRELYGLYEVRQTRGRLERLVVVEGYMDVVRLHQAGIGYAVATLGTATTPEHLKRIFRIVREVVFAFDGDRAGRAAAWRALGNALPEARDGFEIRFLFLPEGHDPDTLVAAEGRDRFEARIGAAMPLSEYLVEELSSQSDLAHADGRARFAEAARPLVAKLPDGIYAELVTARVAQAIGIGTARLQELWSRAAAGTGGAGGPAPGATAPRGSRGDAATDLGRPPRGGAEGRRPGAGTAAMGRGSVMRQAIEMLVHRPALARQVDESTVAALGPLQQRGAPLLRELVAELRAEPCASTAVLLERWRDREEFEHLKRLSERPSPFADDTAARTELLSAIARLRAENADRRLDDLIDRQRDVGLAPAEQEELRALLAARQARR